MISAIATRNLALFCDFENIALGVRDARYDAFDIQKVLEKLLLKGNIVVKKAYCDWARYREFKTGPPLADLARAPANPSRYHARGPAPSPADLPGHSSLAELNIRPLHRRALP